MQSMSATQERKKTMWGLTQVYRDPFKFGTASDRVIMHIDHEWYDTRQLAAD